MSCNNVGPGSGAYKLPSLVGYEKHDITKNRRPMYSFGLRPSTNIKPGPGPNYKLDKIGRYGKDTTPAYSLQSRHADHMYIGPAPNAYAPTNPCKGPQYSLQSRGATLSKSVGPGAAAYGLPSTLGTGGFRLTGRGLSKIDNRSPGPAAYGFYNPDIIKPTAGKYSITSRHDSQFKMQSPGPAAYYSSWNSGKGPYSFSFGVRHSVCSPPYIIQEDNVLCE